MKTHKKKEKIKETLRENHLEWAKNFPPQLPGTWQLVSLSELWFLYKPNEKKYQKTPKKLKNQTDGQRQTVDRRKCKTRSEIVFVVDLLILK